ncbi:DNA-formamidopyrimidine glycosylase [Candidatus Parcubacteria bacterium A4]|nr:MAG: DNA-formamidopyrimidine glycosylase [Candidatus Parcubacteria bacterium A4]
MPELPEVETIVRGLQNVLDRTFFDVWTDSPKQLKKPASFLNFKKEIKGKKIKKIWRRGKNIIFDLSSGLSLLIHQKLTGRLLVGKWKEDRVNNFLRFIFWLDDGSMLALSDLRRFAKIELWNTRSLLESKEINSLGPEPLDKKFTFVVFEKRLRKKRGRIKQVLMDQSVIAGIGNIYSDEILFRAGVNPLKKIFDLEENELREIYANVKPVLKKAIKLHGESFSNFRDVNGEKGNFDKEIKVYQRQGEKCFVCGATIECLKIGGRTAHFCPRCQEL